MAKPNIQNEGRTITVRVPISIRKRGGRKIVLAPDGMEHDSRTLRCHQVDKAMVKALARGFRWREMLETGAPATIKEIAGAEKINQSYVARVIRLTLLAPDLIEMILEGRHPAALTLPTLMKRRESIWTRQRAALVCCPSEQSSSNRPVCFKPR